MAMSAIWDDPGTLQARVKAALGKQGIEEAGERLGLLSRVLPSFLARLTS